ncbi:hypothetical protein IZ6_25660 [Terrihabitans soli]|uniref:Uncharacterized protein n=1 Tax=Terrihabitans soli TaxID=708113 RepID=A0A6S6QXS4_9HYPH|nr:hypothetical protein [Terrihabitans soli]BCJ91831.1 hypothetical protein IZ6_25660 [Terrihabitans soli]
MKIDDRELASILAGLRLLQQTHVLSLSNDIINIMTDGDQLVPLSPAEIDELCERINC